jgi:hypothetical protein
MKHADALSRNCGILIIEENSVEKNLQILQGLDEKIEVIKRKLELSEDKSCQKVQFTQERVEYNVFLFDEPRKGSKSLKIFKISLTFRFDKLSHLSKSVHTGEISQILTVSNKKHYYESKMNVLCPEVKTILALKFDSQ